MVDPVLLNEIVENIEGNSRSEILRKCIEKGYHILSNQASQDRGRGLILSSPPQLKSEKHSIDNLPKIR